MELQLASNHFHQEKISQNFSLAHQAMVLEQLQLQLDVPSPKRGRHLTSIRKLGPQAVCQIYTPRKEEETGSLLLFIARRPNEQFLILSAAYPKPNFLLISNQPLRFYSI